MSDPRRSPAADVQTTFLKEPMGLLGITLFGAYFLLLSLLAIYVLIKI